MKKEIVYTMPCETADDRTAISDLKQELYQRYDSVQVYPNGVHEVRLVAEGERATPVLDLSKKEIGLVVCALEAMEDRMLASGEDDFEDVDDIKRIDEALRKIEAYVKATK